MKPLLFLSVLFLLQGCLDSSTKKQIETSTLYDSQQAYIPFQTSVGLSDQTVALYISKGTVETTQKIYEASSPNTTREVLRNFIIFGEYIYYDLLVQYYGESPDIIKQLRTNIVSNKTETLPVADSYISQRAIVNDVMYVKSDFTDDSLIKKYSKDGNFTRVKDINQTSSAVLSTGKMKLYNENLYMRTSLGMARLNTKTDKFTHLNIDSNFTIYGYEFSNDTLYMLVYNPQSNAYELQDYDLGSGTSSLLQTFDLNILYFLQMRMVGTKLFIYISQDGRLSNPYNATFDTQTNTLHSFTETHNAFLDRAREYKNKLYYGSFDNGISRLLESDGTETGTKKILDALGNDIYAGSLTVINDKLYFANGNGTDGQELWVYDGNTAKQLVDINVGSGSSFPKYMTKLNDGIIFQASPDGVTNHLYYYHNGLLDIVK